LSLSSLINLKQQRQKKDNKERNLTKGLCCCAINVALAENGILQMVRKGMIKT